MFFKQRFFQLTLGFAYKHHPETLYIYYICAHG